MLSRGRTLDYGGGVTGYGPQPHRKELLWLLVSVVVGLWRQGTVLDGEEHSVEKAAHLSVSGKQHLF